MCDYVVFQRAETEGCQTEEGQGDGSLEFPFANLYELENRVFTESWSIPYKKDESLGKCLVAATRLAEESESKLMFLCSFLSELYLTVSIIIIWLGIH